MSSEDSENRPSPEALLDAARREGRGRLKIFLGAAPGVGKTYAMLRAAHRRKAEGVAVVVGVVETHGRRETEELLSGLDVLPRRDVVYRGQRFGEFDLDAALARRPTLVLVDELAHSNVAGSRHPKRFMDVEDLLAAGIDVYTTLNVQHVESLNDVVAQITRIRVRETVPDRLLERADEIELVDTTPEELLQRLKDGKVYVPENAARAMRHFFQPGNLTALRELALRRAADRVDDQMVAYMQRHGIEGPWPAGERILVCIGPDALGDELIRSGSRLADMMNGYWVALHVERPAGGQDPARQARIAETLRAAERLGGTAVTVPGADLVEEILGYARRHNITQIVVGRTRRSGLARLVGRSLVDALLKESGKIALHIVGGQAPPRGAWRPEFGMPGIGRYGWSFVALAGAIALSHLIEPYVPAQSLTMIFLVAVLATAVRLGIGPAILVVLLSFFAYNFFFVQPLYTFTVAGTHELLALVVLLIAGIVTGTLAGRVRDQAAVARRRYRATQALYDFSRKLGAAAKTDDLLWAVASQAAALIAGRCVVLLPANGELALRSAYPPDAAIDVGDAAAARWAFERKAAAGWGTNTLPQAHWHFRPLLSARGALGVVGVQRNDGGRALTADEDRTLQAVVDQAGVAAERAELAAEMVRTQAVVETEKLRGALLSSISHDLRTPLASILGSATSLRHLGDRMDAAARQDLLLNIQEEAERLNRFVANLLDMTRLEGGGLAVTLALADTEALIEGAAKRIEPRLGRRRIVQRIADGARHLRVDPALMEQVLFNILDNAVKYGPDGSAVTVEAMREGEAVVIEIGDEGPGIPAADLERVFDKFYRVRRSDSRTDGTGLGLSICRGFVEAMGGTVTAISPGRHGVGLTLRLRFPAPAAGDAA